MIFFATAMLNIMQSQSFFHYCYQKQSVHKYTYLEVIRENCCELMHVPRFHLLCDLLYCF